jgi:hypothetical protein
VAALPAGTTEAEALAQLQFFFGALDRELASPVAGLPKPALIRFELGATGQPGWIWEVRASPDAAGSVTSPPPTGMAASPAAEPPTPPMSASAAASADCMVGCTLVDFLGLATGRIKPAVAMLRGKIRIRGDRSVFLGLRAPMAAAAKEYKAAAEAAAAAAAAAAGADRPSASLAVRVVGVSTVVADGQAYATYTVRPALQSCSRAGSSRPCFWCGDDRLSAWAVVLG